MQIREFARGPGRGSNDYHYSGFLTLQRAVELFVQNLTHSLSTERGARGNLNSALAFTVGVEDPLGGADRGSDEAGQVWGHNTWLTR